MFRSSRGRGCRRALAAVAAAALTAIVGCSGPDVPKNESAESGTLDWWGYSPNKAVAESLIREFNEEYPNITVRYKFYPNNSEYPAALRAGLASNTGPDLYNLSTNAAAPVSQFGPLAVDLAPAFGPDWKDKVSRLARDSFTLPNGSLAGAALGSVSAGLLYINKDLFDRYGLAAPGTLAEWVRVCETFRANGVQCFTIGAGTGPGFNSDTLHAIANSIHPGKWQEASTGKASWDESWFVDTLKAWKNLQTAGIIPEGAIGLQQYPDANNTFLQQKAAMVQMGTWYNGYLIADNMKAGIQGAGVAEATPFTLLPVPFPDLTNKGNPGVLFSDVDTAIAISRKSDSINAATTFVTWLSTSEKGQQEIANRLELTPDSGKLPDLSQVRLVNPDVQQPALKALADAAGKNSVEGRYRLLAPKTIQAIVAASTSVLEGTSTPEAAAAAVQAAASGK
jgi:raffinose/stachyose/melibiose transport system substrate-binding protein